MDQQPESPKLSNELNKTLHHTINSPNKSAFDDALGLLSREDKHELNQEEIEEFEKANIEDMGIPVTGGMSPSSHKFSTSDMDGIILDPISFHSSDDFKDDLQITSDQYEDKLLYISSPSADSVKDSLGLGSTGSDDSLSDKSSASSLFNLNGPANFLESSFNNDDSAGSPTMSNLPMPHSFISKTNHGINEFDKLSYGMKSIADTDLYKLILQYNKTAGRSMIEFDHNKPYESFDIEIDDWFISNELSHLKDYRNKFFKYSTKEDYSTLSGLEQDAIVEKLIKKLYSYYDTQDKFDTDTTIELENSVLLSSANEIIFNKLTKLYNELPVLQQLTYLAFGNYGFINSKESQSAQMKAIHFKLLSKGYLNITILNLKKYAQVLRLISITNMTEKTNSAEASSFLEALKPVNEFWFLTLTNFYLLLNTYLFEFVDYKDKLINKFELDKDVDTDFEDEKEDPTSAALAESFEGLSIDTHSKQKIKEQVLKTLRESKILVFLVKYVEKWRWQNKILMKIRNVLLLISKLVVIEFGNMKNFLKAKRYLAEKFHIKTKQQVAEENMENQEEAKKDKEEELRGESKKLAKALNEPILKHVDTSKKLYAFPLDYYVYSKDLASRYPGFQSTQPTYPKYLDNNTSLSQFIEVPRTVNNQFLNNCLPVPTIHIATPAPSPSASPTIGPMGNRYKRTFQTNQAYPFIHPTDEENNVPYSIKEASNIFANSVVESFAKQQLWNERVRFMQQERGWKSSINPTTISLDNDIQYKGEGQENCEKDEYDILDIDSEVSKFPQYRNQIATLAKIEEYYREIFPTLGSLVHVLVQIIKTNDHSFENNILTELTSSKSQGMDSDLYSSYMNNNDSNNSSSGEGNNSRKNSSSSSKIDEKLLKQKLEIIKTKEVALKNSSSILSLFMKWFKISHVLKAENLGTIIFDSGYVDILLGFISNANFKDKIFNEEIQLFDSSFFSKCLKLSLVSRHDSSQNNKGPDYYFYDNLLKSDPERTKDYYQSQHMFELEQLLQSRTDLSSPPQPIDHKRATKQGIYDTEGAIFNHRYCIILNNLFKVLQKVILNKTRRSVGFSEKQPVEIFRPIIMHFYNFAMYKSILKIFKEIIPYNGRKWKSVNMDLISMIYINLNLKLKDNWLSGRDIDSEVGDSEGQELALRALVQFYTARKYENGILRFGYERRNSDFFGRETDLIASYELNE